MDATALVQANLAIQIHAGAAMLAVVLGTLVLVLRKGTRLHKAMGRAWVGLMVLVALSSFLITEVRMLGPYSLIHALSLFALLGLVQAIRAIRRGDVRAHRANMIGLYCGALLLAGAFTLVPGRRMHQVLFADGGWTAAWLALGFAVAVGAVLLIRRAVEGRTALAGQLSGK